MKYHVLQNRGVPEDGAPFILDEAVPLTLDFGVTGLWAVKLTKSMGKTITDKLIDGKAKIPCYRLSPGVWYVELLELNENFAVIKKVICTPIVAHSLATATTGLITYPDIDTVVKHLSELFAEVEKLKYWREEVAPLIHVHKIIK